MHVLRNILIPIVTVIGLQFGALIAFAIVTESVFAWPGMGKLLIDSINLLDRPVIVAYLLVIVTFFIVINLVVDILYSLLDPRVRLIETRPGREPADDEERRDSGADRDASTLPRATLRDNCVAVSPLQRIASDFLANPMAVAGLALLALIVVAAIARR